MINRRQFLNYAGITSLGLTIPGCSSEPEPGRYTNEDIELLSSQRRTEALARGKGVFGQHVYQGYKGLANLPWFELDENDKLVCVDDAVPFSIDMHAHLGMSALFKPELDLQASSPRVMHLLDCDNQDDLCDLELDQYINGNFTEKAQSKLQKDILSQFIWGSEVVRTHTISNLLAEMDSMRIAKAAILPIKFDLPFGDDQSETWRSEITKSHSQDRLLAGFSVHPLKKNCIDEMREHAKSGFKLMKLHPTVQKFYPDDPALMPLYEEAASLGVSIFFHGGRAGIEPESSHRYAMPRHYMKPLKDFPSIQFILGHGGARDVDAMLEVKLMHNNAWLGTHGQGISKLDQIIDKTNSKKIVFGSDWPFYHLASSLAKVLIVTESQSRNLARENLLRNNAVELLNLINN